MKLLIDADYIYISPALQQRLRLILVMMLFLSLATLVMHYPPQTENLQRLKINLDRSQT